VRENKAMGIVLPGGDQPMMGALIDNRTVGAVPFGGRYRLIDFILSSFVHAGIWDVGVITRNKYESLMEHLGSGRDWDLARKGGGLTLLPPLATSDTPCAGFGEIKLLADYRRYITNQPARYVVLAHTDLVGQVQLDHMIEYHAASGADVTVAYSSVNDEDDHTLSENRVVLGVDADGRVIDVSVGAAWQGPCNLWLGILVVSKEKLLSLIGDMNAHSRYSIARDLLQGGVGRLSIGGYRVDGYCRRIHSVLSYYRISMQLLDPALRRTLFDPARPVLTRVRDEVPVKYGLAASVKNSLVADGCTIDGEVENSILFRGAIIKKNAKISNCIIMQQTTVEEDAQLSYVIADRRCYIKQSRLLSGFASYPVVVGQESVV
jgi:glucose-1-phosphate adenylyltransferase